MVSSHRPALIASVVISLFTASALLVSACKKPAPSSVDTGSDGSASIAVAPSELNPDGSLAEAALRKVETANAAGKSVTVNFVRAAVSDAGLKQLGQYKHLRRVIAYGGRVTSQGIDALKKDIPEVEIQK
jgi:hypothetical protein